MRELINIVINSLSALENDGKIMISKKSDTEYVISGRGQEGDIPYKYDVVIKFTPVSSDSESMNDDEMEKIRDAVRKEIERMKTESLMQTISQYVMANDQKTQQQQQTILNEEEKTTE